MKFKLIAKTYETCRFDSFYLSHAMEALLRRELLVFYVCLNRMSTQLLQDIYYKFKSEYVDLYNLLFPLSEEQNKTRTGKDVEIIRRHIFYVVDKLFIFCIKNLERPRYTSRPQAIKDIWPFDFCMWHVYGQFVKAPSTAFIVLDD